MPRETTIMQDVCPDCGGTSKDNEFRYCRRCQNTGVVMFDTTPEADTAPRATDHARAVAAVLKAVEPYVLDKVNMGRFRDYLDGTLAPFVIVADRAEAKKCIQQVLDDVGEHLPSWHGVDPREVTERILSRLTGPAEDGDGDG